MYTVPSPATPRHTQPRPVQVLMALVAAEKVPNPSALGKRPGQSTVPSPAIVPRPVAKHTGASPIPPPPPPVAKQAGASPILPLSPQPAYTLQPQPGQFTHPSRQHQPWLHQCTVALTDSLPLWRYHLMRLRECGRCGCRYNGNPAHQIPLE